MKKTYFEIFSLTVFSRTKENNGMEADFKSDLLFQSVTIVTEGAANGDIEAVATVVGSNLCYNFTHFDVNKERHNQFNIYARGTVLKPEQVYAEAIYRKDTTVSIPKPAPGYLHLGFLES